MKQAPTAPCALTNEPRVSEEAVSVVLLQTATNRAWLRLAVCEKICKARSVTRRKSVSLKIKPAGILTFYSLFISRQHLVFFNLNIRWTRFNWWGSFTRIHFWSQNKKKKSKKTAKRDKMTGKCVPFTKRNTLHFHAKKKNTRDTFYHEWSFCLDLNSGICYCVGTEHSFCWFSDYTKLYDCASRALLLHYLRQNLL